MNSKAGSQTGVRPSPIAGRWYPGNPENLASQIDGYLDAVRLPELHGEVVAVMVPHAGIEYSGPVAAYAFAAMRSTDALRSATPDLVAVVSPMHHPYTQPILTTSYRAYSTPLGEVPVDAIALQQLDMALQSQSSVFALEYLGADPEHSLEIELPFLQRIFPTGFSLLPIMVRDPRPAIARALGKALSAVLKDRSAILVASTDLSHFYSQQAANLYDTEFLRQVQSFDPLAVLQVEEQGKGFACGRGALAAVMWAALSLGANHAQLLHYATSGDVSGDYSRVVGYAAAVFTNKPVA